MSTISLLSRVLITIAVMFSIAVPQPVLAQSDWTAACLDTEFTDVATLKGIECLVANLLSTATTLIGIAAFGMIIVGSFTYLTSGGNPKGTEAGKKAITYAIIGIAISVSAWAILAFIANVFGLEILKTFLIPTI